MKSLPPAFKFKSNKIQHPKKKKVHGVAKKGLGPSMKVPTEMMKARLLKY